MITGEEVLRVVEDLNEHIQENAVGSNECGLMVMFSGCIFVVQ